MTKKYVVSSEQAEDLVRRLYEQNSTEAPSDSLDEKILAQAKAAAQSETVEQEKTGFWQQWQRFGSVAATVVVVVTIGLIYQQNRQQLIPESPVILQSESTPGESTPETSASLPVAKKKAAVPGTERVFDDAAMEEIREQDSVAGETKAESYADSDSEDTFEAEAVVEKQVEKEVTDAPVGLLNEAIPVEQSARQKPQEEAESAQPVTMDAAPKPAQFAAPAAKTTPKFKTDKSEMATGGAAAKSAAPRALQSADSLLKVAPAARPEPLSARQYVETIREAIAKEDLTKAKQLWQLLRETYPDYELPEDLLGFFSNDFQVGEPP